MRTLVSMLRATTVALALSTALGQASAVELIVNGDFETGSLNPWGRFADGIGAVGGLDGDVLQWDAAAPGAPGPGVPLFTPNTGGQPHGAFVARGVYQEGSSGGVLMTLYQSFTAAPSTTSAILRFDMFAQTSSNFPVSLGVGLNTGVTALEGDASSTDFPVPTALTLISTSGIPDGSAFTPYVFDISALVAGGGTFTLGFVMRTSSAGVGAWGIDNVSIQTRSADDPGGAVPLPSSIALIGLGLACLALTSTRRARKLRPA